jgi:hypothetical protein
MKIDPPPRRICDKADSVSPTKCVWGARETSDRFHVHPCSLVHCGKSVLWFFTGSFSPTDKLLTFALQIPDSVVFRRCYSAADSVAHWYCAQGEVNERSGQVQH